MDDEATFCRLCIGHSAPHLLCRIGVIFGDLYAVAVPHPFTHPRSPVSGISPIVQIVRVDLSLVIKVSISLFVGVGEIHSMCSYVLRNNTSLGYPFRLTRNRTTFRQVLTTTAHRRFHNLGIR